MSDALAEMMLHNLREVFSERDPVRRKAALAAIYAEDAVLYEAEGQVEGREAIDAQVGSLLNRFPAAFAFTPRGEPARNHDIGRLCWELGPAGAQRSGPAWMSRASRAAGSVRSTSSSTRTDTRGNRASIRSRGSPRARRAAPWSSRRGRACPRRGRRR